MDEPSDPTPDPTPPEVPEAEPAPAPDAQEPTPADAPAVPEWEPPLVFSDYFSHYSVKAIRYTLAGAALLSLTVFAMWVVPTIAVSRSDAYELVSSHAVQDSSLRNFLGTPVVADRAPAWYRIGDDTSSFEFIVRGPRGSARVMCDLQQGRISKFDTTYALGWMGDPPPRRRPR